LQASRRLQKTFVCNGVCLWPNYRAPHWDILQLMKQTWRFGLPAFLAACILCAHATAQDLPPASPESVGLSAARLARIATTVDQSIQEKRIAGAVTLVARHGRVAWLKAQGMLDREAARPMPADAIFRICSMSKPITSLAVMMLYEEGRFLLDDPVSKYIPEFKNPKVLVKSPAGRSYPIPATREITIRNLLTHTSGLTYQWNGDLGQTYKDANVASGLLPYDGTIGDSVKRLAVLPLLFNPGERFEYSLGVDVWASMFSVIWWRCSPAKPLTSSSTPAFSNRSACGTRPSIHPTRSWHGWRPPTPGIRRKACAVSQTPQLSKVHSHTPRIIRIMDRKNYTPAAAVSAPRPWITPASAN
jgi:hypothetical protein